MPSATCFALCSSPLSPGSDHVDERGGYPVAPRQALDALTARATRTNSTNICVSEFGARVLFSSVINESSLPLKNGVTRQRDPLKVGREVIQFVAVDVIDRGPVEVTWNECQRNQAVNKELGAAPITLDLDVRVAVLPNPLRNDAAAPQLRRLKRPGGLCNPVQSANVTAVRDLSETIQFSVADNGFPGLNFHVCTIAHGTHRSKP